MSEIKLIQGDITTLAVDAIVNAANKTLLGGGGVDGAIHRGGGMAILADCMKIRAKQGGCATGEAVITTAGALPATFVIHTVGPIWSSKNKEKHKTLLANCYENSLHLAVKNKVKTIAFPNISTGVYRFPKPLAAEIAIQTVQKFLESHPEIEELTFVCFDFENFKLYHDILRS